MNGNRVLRSRSVGKCSCKVGRCRICGSACKRYKCSCNGFSPLEDLSRRMGRPKRKKAVTRNKIDDKLAQQPRRNIRRRGTNYKDTTNNNTDDSSYAPTIGMCPFIDTDNANESEPNPYDVISTLPNSPMMHDELLFTEGINHLHTIIQKFSIPKNHLQFKKFLSIAIKYNTIIYNLDLKETIHVLLESLHLPTSSISDVYKLLICTSNNTNLRYRLRSTSVGKQLSSLSEIRRLVMKIAPLCKVASWCKNIKKNSHVTNFLNNQNKMMKIL